MATIQITKSDGAKSTVGITLPSEPGRYKIQAKLSNGSTITTSQYFYRRASITMTSRTLKLRFGLSNGTSQDVSFSFLDLTAKAPSVSATCEQKSDPSVSYKWYEVTGTIKNNNSFPVMCHVEIYFGTDSLAGTGKGIINAGSQASIDSILAQQLASANARLVVWFMSKDDQVSVAGSTTNDFGNYTDPDDTTTTTT